jgi:hypothetical protein
MGDKRRCSQHGVRCADDLSRRALEAPAIEEYENGHLTAAELRRMLASRRGPRWTGFIAR